eukprot:TRINITY_DN11787_c0_g2_i1.p1 TRINITY_DN11787_c0_g2~~TRINITY_DN11787_c0_g2_i1.p1  ORF type:complete len:933 (+),score=142.43 TRINITY_DN11787_c0_g2_i1:62-2800(+)
MELAERKPQVELNDFYEEAGEHLYREYDGRAPKLKNKRRASRSIPPTRSSRGSRASHGSDKEAQGSSCPTEGSRLRGSSPRAGTLPPLPAEGNRSWGFIVCVAAFCFLGLAALNVRSMIQAVVNMSHLTVDSVTIYEATDTSFRLSAKMVVTKPWYAAAFDCALEPMDRLELSWLPAGSRKGRYLGHTKLNAQKLTGRRSSIEMDEAFSIDDAKSLADFGVSFLQSKGSVVWRLQGTLPSIKVSLLPGTWGPIYFRQQVKIQGLGGLTDIRVDGLDLPRDGPDGRGAVAVINTTIHNPSVLQMELGDVDMNISFQGALIGRARASGMFLGTGDNQLTLDGLMKPEDPVSASVFFSQYLVGKEGMSVASASCSSCPSWLNEMLGAMKSPVVVPGYRGPSMIARMEAKQLGLSIMSDKNIKTNATFEIAIAIPFAISLSIASMNASLSLSLPGSNQVAAKLVMPWRPVWWTPGPGPQEGAAVVQASMVKLDVVNSALMADLMKNMLTGAEASLAVTGVGNAVVEDSALGHLVLTGIPVQAIVVPVNPALNNLPGMVCEDLNIIEARPSYLTITARVKTPNPSPISMYLPAFPGNLRSEDGRRLGHVFLKDVNIFARRDSYLDATITIFADSLTEGRTANVFSRYVSNVDQTLFLDGDAAHSNLTLEIVKPALEALKTRATLAGGDSLIKFVKMQFDLKSIVKKQLPVSILVADPWDQGFVVNKLTADIWAGSDYVLQLGFCNSTDEIKVNARNLPGQWTDPPMVCELRVDECRNVGKLGRCMSTLKALGGRISLILKAELDAVIGGQFHINLAYQQQGLQASFLQPSDKDIAAQAQAAQSATEINDWNDEEAEQIYRQYYDKASLISTNLTAADAERMRKKRQRTVARLIREPPVWASSYNMEKWQAVGYRPIF